MALAVGLEELLSHMDPADAEATKKILEKSPQLGEGWLRQADYDRLMNATKEEKKNYESLKGKWQTWADENGPKLDKALSDNKLLLEDKKTLEAKIAGMPVGEIEMDEATLKAKVSERVKEIITEGGYVSQTDLSKIVLEEGKKLIAGEREDFLTKTFPAATNFISTLVDVQLRHNKEFNEVLDRTELSKFMQENKILDPVDGYNRWIEPRRRKVEVETEVSKRVADEMSKRNIPGVTPGPAEKGPLEIKIQGLDPLAGKEVSLGDNQAAMAAAQELRATGSF